MTVIIFKPTLTATAKVFDQRAIGCGLTPEGVSKPAGGAEYLHRNVVAFALRRTHFRGVQIVRIARVVEDQTIRFSRRQTQPSSDDLLIQANGLGRAQDRNEIDMWGVKPGGQHRYVDQIAKALGFEILNQHISLCARRVTGDQCGIVCGQQTNNLFRVLHGSGKYHDAFTRLGKFNNLADDMRCYPLLFFQLMVEVSFAEQTITLCLQAAEVILDDRHVEALWRRQIAVLNHVAQRQLINTVAKKRFFIAAHHTVIMKMVNPAFTEAERRGGQSEQA